MVTSGDVLLGCCGVSSHEVVLVAQHVVQGVVLIGYHGFKVVKGNERLR